MVLDCSTASLQNSPSLRYRAHADWFYLLGLAAAPSIDESCSLDVVAQESHVGATMDEQSGPSAQTTTAIVTTAAIATKSA